MQVYETVQYIKNSTNVFI